MTNENLNKAVWRGVAPINIQGNPSKKLMVILRARGCEWAKTGGPCNMCNYYLQCDKRITTTNLINQFQNAIAKYDFNRDKIGRIDIFNSGSFLNNKEVPEKARLEIMKLINNIKSVKEVLIESRPEFIKKKKIKKLQSVSGKKTLIIGIGLESSDNYIRETCVNKGFNLKVFENAVRIIKDVNCVLNTYVLVKPPFLSEKEAIDDAVKTIKCVFSLKKKMNV